MTGVIPTLIQDDPEFSDQPPLVLIHDGGGTTINYYYLGDMDRHVWGISNERLLDEAAWPGGINQLARTYVDLIRSEVPPGPLIVGGWSVGGLIAFEMARILAENSDFRLLGVVMLDTYYPSGEDTKKDAHAVKETIKWGEATTEESKQATLASLENSSKFSMKWVRQLQLEDASATSKHPPVVLLRATESHGISDAALRSEGAGVLGWERQQSGFFSRVLNVPGNHYTLFTDDNVDGLTEALSDACEGLEAGGVN